VNLRSRVSAEFWAQYKALPIAVQRQADKAYRLFTTNPFHPSLHFKAAGPYWSVRVSRGYRALAQWRDNGVFWFWIGPHDEYEALLKVK
jgi:hypothetical protein